MSDEDLSSPPSPAKAQFSTRHIRHFAGLLRKNAAGTETADSPLMEAIRDSSSFRIERVLTFSDKLLRKAIKRFKLSPRSVDGLTANALLRHAGLHGLLTAVQVERFLVLRQVHMSRATDDVPGFVASVWPLLPQFADDLEALADRLEAVLNETD